MSYAIENITTGELVKSFSELPKAFDLPDGRRVIAPVQVGDEGLGHRMIEVVKINPTQPGTYFTKGQLLISREGNQRIETQEWLSWTQIEIDNYETLRKQNIANQFDNAETISRLAVLALQQELNRSNRVLTALTTAIIQGTNLADIKTRLQALPEKARETTPAQLKAAIEAGLGL